MSFLYIKDPAKRTALVDKYVKAMKTVRQRTMVNLSFDECLVCEFYIGKRKLFYSVCFRSPSIKAGESEFN